MMMFRSNKKALRSLKGFGQVLTLAAAPLLVQQVVGVDGLVQVSGTVAVAEKTKPDASKYKTRKTSPIRQSVSKQLGKAQKLLEVEDWAGARKALKGVLSKSAGKLNGNELANIYNFIAYSQYSQDDYKGAIESYKEVVVQEGTSLSLQTGVMKTLGQLYMQVGKYDLAIKQFKEWMAMSAIVGSDTYYLISQCYYQTGDMKSALTWVSKAIDNYTVKGKLPKESWYSMQAALYYEEGNTNGAIKVFEIMAKHWNKAKTWKSLSGLYGMKERSKDQLHAMEVAYMRGILDKESQLTTLAALFMQQEVPYKAAKVMEKGLKDKIIKPTSKNLEIMGNAFSMAQEKSKAIGALEKAAAKSDEGKIYYNLGAKYLDDEKYKKAESVLRKSLKKGGLRSKGMAQLYLGQALFYLDKFKEADKYLTLASKDKKSKKAALQWKRYMSREVQRRKSLQI